MAAHMDRVRYWTDQPLPRWVHAIKGLGTQLMHAHFGTDATDIWPSTRAAGLPMLVTLHGYDIQTKRDWWESGAAGLRRRVYPKRLLRMAKDRTVRFIAVSSEIKRRAVEFGIPESKIYVVPIGVDAERFRPAGLPLAQRPKRVLFVGRMVEKKAPLLLIRAFESIRSAVPEAELVMAGDGPLLPAAVRLARELRLPVQFRGALTSKQVEVELREARVFCLPSIEASNGDAEGLPITILEAMASGVAVVTSARGADGDLILNGQNGFFADPGDQEQVSALTVSILRSDDLALRLTESARHRILAKFDLHSCSRLLETVYEEARFKGVEQHDDK